MNAHCTGPSSGKRRYGADFVPLAMNPTAQVHIHVFRELSRRMPQTIDPERLEQCVCFSVRKAARAITRVYDEALKPTGLEATQFTILAALAVGKRFTMSGLAQLLVMDRTTLTRSLVPLKKLGYVRVSAEGRQRLLELSGAGKRKLRAAFPRWRTTQRRAIDEFGRPRLVSLLDQLQAATEMAARL
jgi:DNA-binding MarR family transcriptional regulator